MKRRILAPAVALLLPVAALVFLLALLSSLNLHRSGVALAAPAAPDPTVTNVSPNSSPNDLDTPIVITGTDFDVGATVQLGNNTLEDAGWVSSTTLTATVPWGLDPGVYTLTVENPDDSPSSLTDAVTVTEGIGVWNPGALYGGAVESVVVNPVTPTTLYAASSKVGLFQSRDGGESWSLLFAGTAGVEDPVLNPHAPDTVYAHLPWTLYRSDDEGDTWTPLYPQFPFTETSEARCHLRIRAYVHPISDTVFAAACGAAHGNQSGLLMSDDDGETWISVTNGITDTRITALAFHPTHSETMYVGTGSGHVFTTANGGMTWTHAAKPVGYVGDLAVSPSGSELWVVSNDTAGDPCLVRKAGTGNLASWTTLTQTAESCSHPGPSITFVSGTTGTVFVADFGLDILQGLIRTTDGGTNWTALSPEGRGVVQDIAVNPAHTDTLHAAMRWEGGMFKTTDGGASWQLANQGLSGLYPRNMEVHPDKPYVVYAELNSEDLHKGTRGGETWQHLLSPPRAQCIEVDPFTVTRLYAGVGGTESHIGISDDGGRTWVSSAPFPIPVEDVWSSPEELLAVPKQPGILLASVGVHGNPGIIYRSPDYGASWTPVYTHTWGDHEALDLEADAVLSNTIYAATPNGEDGLLISTDGGRTWDRTGVGKEGIEYAESIAVEPEPPYRVFVLTGYQSRQLYVSANHGLTWTRVISSWNVPNAAGIVFAGADPPALYATGVQEGLLRSPDGGETWQPAAGVLGQIPVYSLATATDTGRVFVYAGTTGGWVEETESQFPSPTALDATAEETLVTAGVYRYTTRRARKVYVPLVLRSR
jgi:photosystem II stability/assembly factor-like uncharacterized protein